jgi:Putative auto-transporter adhesin, head GIN domain
LSQESIRVERSLSHSFHALSVSVVPVVIHVGHPHQGLVLQGEGSVLEQIRTEVQDNTLIIGPAEGASFSTDVPIEVDFAMPTLTQVSASAGAQVRVENMSGDGLDVEAASGARVKVSGRVGAVRAFAQSGGTVDLSRLSSRNVSSRSSSGGRIQ